MVQNIIAMLYDFDLTLSPHYMQKPIFEDPRFSANITQEAFWKANDLLITQQKDAGKRIHKDTAYLELIRRMVQPGQPLEGLTDTVLHELGSKITYFPGIPEFFDNIREDIESEPVYKQAEIKIEHYVVSTGLLAMIEGSAVAPYMEHIEACEFFYDSFLVPIGVSVALTHLQKTEVPFKINKGVYQNPSIDVNDSMPYELRRVPFKNMIYFGDGPSDVPCMSVIKSGGGYAFAVYDPNPTREGLKKNPGRNAFPLHRAGRVDFCVQANYHRGTDLYVSALNALSTIADRIVEEQEALLRKSTIKTPRHF